ncbi:hypothetical protein [Acinetobacter bereziniae]|uniref:hypothetical protein n=1 Tax=Acinetobacter bereziniae TaxID=106648 RepID=UPI0011162EAE|nr:hypothetical protein [Acinetobacter bereziniae]TNL47916.1 hypothetical protein EYB59_14360 [Acinetobacter bereziniae]TNL58194.1 hypothetical protein EYY58_12325 [Acinetobacter bereziniae]
MGKADIQALAQLALLVDTKADQSYVKEQIANLVGSAPEELDTIYELVEALQAGSNLLESLNEGVAIRVRFDIATQALTEIQKQNARTNIGAEKLGTAQEIVSRITAQSLGAATAAQGAKADTALQSADVAPVALSGLFSSLTGQNKIFDVVYSAYTEGVNAEITAADTLGVMLRKLQKQIKSGSKVEWIRADLIGTFNTYFGHGQINGSPIYMEFAKINGCLWIRGFMKIPYGSGLAYTLTDKTYNVLTQSNATSIVSSISMFLTPSPVRLWFRSDNIVSDTQTASDATQTFLIPDNSSNGVYHIPAQCLGSLAN